MTPFRSAPAGYVARWEPLEREVLARVARDVGELLRAESGIGPDLEPGDGVAFLGVGRTPTDPAVQRLLPDAHREDPDVAAEFRHLTQTDLATGKAARLEAFAEALDPVPVADDTNPPVSGLDARDMDARDMVASDAHVSDIEVPGAEALSVQVTGEVVVARDRAQEFAGALTDMRTVLAERLGLADDADVEALHDEVVRGLDDDPEDDDRAHGGGPDGSRDAAGLNAQDRRYWGGVFVAAGFAQETLMEEMLVELRAGRPAAPGDGDPGDGDPG